MSFVIDWKKKLGYSKDPFLDLKAKPGELLVNRVEEREKLNLFIIKQSTFANIIAESGEGKTLLLNWLYDQLKSFKTIKISDSAVMKSQALFFNYLFDNITSVFDRVVKKAAELSQDQKMNLLLNKLRKRTILLIDDADSLNAKTLELLKYLVENSTLQLILASKKKVDLSFKNSIELPLSVLKDKEFILLLAKRIAIVNGQGIFPFTKENVSSLMKKAKNNPEQFLKLAREEAIEKSLKVTAPPKERVIMKEEKDDKQKALEEEQEVEELIKNDTPKKKEKKGGWLTIKFSKDDEKELLVLKTSKDNNKKSSKKDSKDTKNFKKNNKNDSNQEEDIQDFLKSLVDEEGK